MAEVDEVWKFHVKVHGKTIEVSAGDATQRVKWLGYVAIARWDDENNQGWKRLGVPTKATNLRKDEIDLNAVIRTVIANGETINIYTSLEPYETR